MGIRARSAPPIRGRIQGYVSLRHRLQYAVKGEDLFDIELFSQLRRGEEATKDLCPARIVYDDWRMIPAGLATMLLVS